MSHAARVILAREIMDAIHWEGDIVMDRIVACLKRADERCTVTHLFNGGKSATRPYPFCGDPAADSQSLHISTHTAKNERDQRLADCPACLRIASVYELRFKANAEWKT